MMNHFRGSYKICSTTCELPSVSSWNRNTQRHKMHEIFIFRERVKEAKRTNGKTWILNNWMFVPQTNGLNHPHFCIYLSLPNTWRSLNHLLRFYPNYVPLRLNSCEWLRKLLMRIPTIRRFSGIWMDRLGLHCTNTLKILVVIRHKYTENSMMFVQVDSVLQSHLILNINIYRCWHNILIQIMNKKTQLNAMRKSETARQRETAMQTLGHTITLLILLALQLYRKWVTRVQSHRTMFSNEMVM